MNLTLEKSSASPTMPVAIEEEELHCNAHDAQPFPPPTHQCVLNLSRLPLTNACSPSPAPASHSPVRARPLSRLPLTSARPLAPRISGDLSWVVSLDEITPPRRTARLALAMRPAMACAVLRGAGRAAQGHDRRPAGNAARCRLCAHPGGGQRERRTPKINAVRVAPIARRAPVAQRPRSRPAPTGVPPALQSVRQGLTRPKACRCQVARGACKADNRRRIEILLEILRCVVEMMMTPCALDIPS